MLTPSRDQSSAGALEDTAFESCAETPGADKAREIIAAGAVRFNSLSDYCDELHFHAA